MFMNATPGGGVAVRAALDAAERTDLPRRSWSRTLLTLLALLAFTACDTATEPVPVGVGVPASIDVSPDTLTLTAGDSATLTAVVRDTHGESIMNAAVEWSSSDEVVALTTETALVHGMSAGNAKIFARAGSAEGIAHLTVEAGPIVNQAPTASITSPSEDLAVSAGDTVHFRGAANDPDGTVASHAWSFGDGASSSLQEPAGHVYETEGSYQATYQVTDDLGVSSPVVSRTVTVEAAAPGRVIVFEDGFESGDLSAWDQFATNKYTVTSDPERVRSGSYALRAEAGDVGELNKWFMPGYTEVHVQFDVMFADGFQNLRSDGYGMHFFGVLGNRTDNRWSAHGKAGIRPDGTDFFVTVLDPVQFHGDPTLRPFFFYTNYPDMTCGGSCYGNSFVQSPPATELVPGQWYQIEIRLRANTTGEHDGAQELWIDGVRKIDAQGMRWRDTDEVRVNEIAVWNYMPGAQPDQYIWIDNLVVTRPSGP
jgi:hypothetical protein